MTEDDPRLERDQHGGVTLWVDDFPQSHVDPADPGLLAFEYLAHLGTITDTLAPAGERLRVTHIGGGALTLPRYVEHTRPGSPQIVLEPAESVTELVRRELPLPRGHRIRVRPVDGRRGLADIASASADLVVLDAFAEGSVPAELTSAEAVGELRRVLAAGGAAALNLPDDPARRYLTRVLATLAAAFGELAIIATHDVLKGRRFGNYVVLAGDILPIAELAAGVARSPFPSGVWGPPRCRLLAASASPLTDADALASPAPPEARGWRVRG